MNMIQQIKFHDYVTNSYETVLLLQKLNSQRNILFAVVYLYHIWREHCNKCTGP